MPASTVPGRAEAGVDEAGRGPLAGPVVAAAVVLPPGLTHPLLRDSKQLTEAQRHEARAYILEHALAWNIGMGSVAVIDRVNILQATLLAMQEALSGIPVPYQAVAVDGNRGFAWAVPVVPVVGGDGRYAHIAAASILAKTYRDELMVALAHDYPAYGWAQNKGYPTAQHRAALAQHGPTPWHRRSYRLAGVQLPLITPASGG
ncbi:MAG: ribonuclease HII [Bacteroidia bacterium]|nr:ribonuclease HII [Bacteroidia bacterium]